MQRRYIDLSFTKRTDLSRHIKEMHLDIMLAELSDHHTNNCGFYKQHRPSVNLLFIISVTIWLHAYVYIPI